MKDEFDEMTESIDVIRKHVHQLYAEWRDACDRLDRLERERTRLFRRRLDALVSN